MSPIEPGWASRINDGFHRTDDRQALRSSTRLHHAFVADAAHQLRTPLAGIRGQVELLSSAVDAGQEPTLRRLRFSVERAIRLANQLLALARADKDANALHLDRFDMATLIGKAADGWVHRAITARVDLGFELAPSPLIGDPYLLGELLENIVDNALRHAPAGGSVTVGTRSDGSNIDIAVDDSGPGIPTALAERVFERFHRGDDSDASGSGLGLAIVRQIALRHGGSVEARTSATLGGLRMLVRIPVAGPLAAGTSDAAPGFAPNGVDAADIDAQAPVPPIRTRPMRVLLVLLVAAAGGTAAASTDDPPNAGERSGVIVAIDSAPDFDEAYDVACKRFAASDAVPDRRYAVVRYFSGRHAHTRVLPLASGLPARVGDRVVFRNSGCTTIDPR